MRSTMPPPPAETCKSRVDHESLGGFSMPDFCIRGRRNSPARKSDALVNSTRFPSAAAADEHVRPIGATRAHMAGGFLEQAELGEDLARQRDLFS